MKALNSALKLVELGVFVLLGAVATQQWSRRRGRERGWLAATFLTLAAVVVAGRFTADKPDLSTYQVVTRLLVLLIVAFPFCLFRFTAAFREPSRWVTRAGNGLTIALVVSTLAIARFPFVTEKRSAVFQAYVVLLVIQWTFLLLTVAFGLWQGGNGKPTVTRRRMKTLSLGSIGLAAALVISAASGSPGAHPLAEAITAMFAIVSAPLFLLGFAPPGIVLVLWRRPEIAKMRIAQAGLIGALTPHDVATVLLPSLAAIVGASAAVLATSDGEVVGSYALSEADAPRLAQHVASGSTRPFREGEVTTAVALQEGHIALQSTPFTPYFGREEFELLRAIAAIADLAISRSRLTADRIAVAEDLREANDALRNFVAVASHDLRTPIAVIKGYTTALRNDWSQQSDEEKLEFIATIDRQTNHLARLVDDLLTLSKLDADALQPVVEAVQLARVVDDVVQDVVQGATEVSLAIGRDVVVSADKDHTYRILRNYVENALKYGAVPIEITASQRDGMVEVCIADAGKGVPDEFAVRLFEKFARASTSSQKGRTGTGLGLSIVKGLAQAGGGNAWYEPNQPHGSRFLVSFRAAKGDS